MQNKEKKENEQMQISPWLAQLDRAKPLQILTQSSVEQKR